MFASDGPVDGFSEVLDGVDDPTAFETVIGGVTVGLSESSTEGVILSEDTIDGFMLSEGAIGGPTLSEGAPDGPMLAEGASDGKLSIRSAMVAPVILS